MDRIFSKILSKELGYRSSWLDEHPLNRAKLPQGYFANCPYCTTSKRKTLRVSPGGASCRSCGSDVDFAELADHCIQTSVITEDGVNEDAITDLRSLLCEVKSVYKSCLRSATVSAEIWRYINGRGISEEMLKKYEIGWAPSNNVLTSLFNDTKNIEMLKEIGLIGSGKFGDYDKFRNRLIFPIKNDSGDTVGFGGRTFLPKDEQAKYINSTNSSIFEKNRCLYGFDQAVKSINNQDAAIVTEGYLDVISLAQHGFTNSVATMGVAINEYHFEKLFRYTDTVYLCFDSDSAGIRAALSAVSSADKFLAGTSKSIFIAILPDGEDPDSLLREKGEAGFVDCLRRSLAVPEFVSHHLVEKYNIEDEFQTTRYLMELIGSARNWNKGLKEHLVECAVNTLSSFNPATIERLLKERL